MREGIPAGAKKIFFRECECVASPLFVWSADHSASFSSEKGPSHLSSWSSKVFEKGDI